MVRPTFGGALVLVSCLRAWNTAVFSALFKTFIDPRDKVVRAVSGALRFRVTRAPYCLEINTFHAVTVFKGKRQIDLRRYRGIALSDSRCYDAIKSNLIFAKNLKILLFNRYEDFLIFFEINKI